MQTSEPRDTPPILHTRALQLVRGSRELVSALDWSVEAGQFWCVLGPNGVGKTTLLHTLAGLLPNAGIYLQGRPMKEWDAEEQARVRGFMPQQIHDAFSASVQDTVLLGRHPHLGRWDWEGANDLTVASQALELTGMQAFASRDVLTLSGGERQRVALAMLLAQEPRLLLLDEPSSHQDLQHQVKIFSILRDLAENGSALVAAVHDINLAARYATHALLLDGAGGADAGPVDKILTPERLSRVFQHPVRQLDDQGRPWFVAA